MSIDTMNRARYLQIRQNASAILALLKETDVATFHEMAQSAIAQGAAKAPAFWADGAPALQKDLDLATLMISLKTIALKAEP